MGSAQRKIDKMKRKKRLPAKLLGERQFPGSRAPSFRHVCSAPALSTSSRPLAFGTKPALRSS